jgi:hypothetical protein
MQSDGNLLIGQKCVLDELGYLKEHDQTIDLPEAMHEHSSYFAGKFYWPAGNSRLYDIGLTL